MQVVDDDVTPDDALEAEVQWLLDTECKDAFSRMRNLLRDVSISLHEDSAAKSIPIRCGSDDDGLLATVVISATSIHAMRMKLTVAKWNHDEAYSALLGGGQKLSIPLPSLVTVKNRVAQAVAALGRGYGDLGTAHTVMQQALICITDAINAVHLALPPVKPTNAPPGVAFASAGLHGQAPSSLSAQLREMLQPPPPDDLTIDVCAAGNPPRLFVTAIIMRPDGTALDSRCVSAVGLDGIEERMNLLEQAAEEARALLCKLDVVAELYDSGDYSHDADIS